MPKIRIDLEVSVINGQTLTFQAPADCSDITGLIIYYPEGDRQSSKDFKFVDAHGVDVGSGTISLFAANSLVKVVLDTDQGKAYIQNADTNAYLEGKLSEKYSPDNKPTPAAIGAAASSHNQAASTVSAGTFAGQVVANSAGQTPGTSLLRNSKIVSSETNPTTHGEINWTYE